MSKRNKYLILITTIMFCVLVDIWIGITLNNHEKQHASLYRTALKTTDKGRFNYIIDSNQGNVVTNTKPNKNFLLLKERWKSIRCILKRQQIVRAEQLHVHIGRGMIKELILNTHDGLKYLGESIRHPTSILIATLLMLTLRS